MTSHIQQGNRTHNKIDFANSLLLQSKELRPLCLTFYAHVMLHLHPHLRVVVRFLGTHRSVLQHKPEQNTEGERGKSRSLNSSRAYLRTYGLRDDSTTQGGYSNTGGSRLRADISRKIAGSSDDTRAIASRGGESPNH